MKKLDKNHIAARMSPNELKPSKMKSARKMGSKCVVFETKFGFFTFFENCHPRARPWGPEFVKDFQRNGVSVSLENP